MASLGAELPTGSEEYESMIWEECLFSMAASMSCLEMELNKAGSCYAFDGWKGMVRVNRDLIIQAVISPPPTDLV